MLNLHIKGHSTIISPKADNTKKKNTNQPMSNICPLIVEIRMTFSCKLSPMETNCMECQALFSDENTCNKKNVEMSSASV